VQYNNIEVTNMSKFMVNMTAVNPKEEHRCTPLVIVLLSPLLLWCNETVTN